MQHINDHTIRNYSAVLDAEFGAPGTEERIAAEKEAYQFYFEQLIEDMGSPSIDSAEFYKRIIESLITVSKNQTDKAGADINTFTQKLEQLCEQLLCEISNIAEGITFKVADMHYFLDLFSSLSASQEREVIRLIQEKDEESFVIDKN